MKKIMIPFILFFLLAIMVTPVSAGNGPGGDYQQQGGGGGQQQGVRGTFAMVGTISALDTNTVTISVVRGNKLVKPYIGTPVALTLTTTTRFLFRDGATSTLIRFADLKVGQPVSANGTVANNVWMTSRITVGASLSCLP